MHLHYTVPAVGREFPALVTGKERIVANMAMIRYGINKWKMDQNHSRPRVRTEERSCEWPGLEIC